MRIIDQVDVGDSVCCDYCNEEFKGNPASGGFLFGSYACCPTCEPRMLARIKKAGEERFIKERCPPGMSFHSWVMELRGGNNTITTYTL
jgi:hypothetical protein